VDDQHRAAVLIDLLARDADARKAALSWPLVSRRLKGRAALTRWARCAGLSYTRIESLKDMLFEHRICLPDRTVDEEALRVIAHVAADTMRRGGKRAPASIPRSVRSRRRSRR
jgi:hypothetical protein